MPRHTQLAVRNVEELCKLLSGLIIASGGVLRNNHSVLLPQKTGEKEGEWACPCSAAIWNQGVLLNTTTTQVPCVELYIDISIYIYAQTALHVLISSVGWRCELSCLVLANNPP